MMWEFEERFGNYSVESNPKTKDHRRLKYTKVQSQQMAFTQSPSLSNNPKIPTYYLIFAEMSNDMKCQMT